MFQVHNVNIRSHRDNMSLRTPASVAKPAGTNYQESATPGLAELADGTKEFAGSVCLDISADIPQPTLAELAGGVPTVPGATYAGHEASFEDFEEREAEGDTMLVPSGSTGQVTAATAVNTRLSFLGGKWCVAQANQLVHGELVEQMTPVVAANGRRVRIRRIRGYKA